MEELERWQMEKLEAGPASSGAIPWPVLLGLLVGMWVGGLLMGIGVGMRMACGG